MDLDTKIISQDFQIALVSSESLFARHLDYSSDFGVFGYLESSSNRHLLFKMNNSLFKLVRDFDVTIERPVGSVCIMNKKFAGTSFDVKNARQLFYKLDTNGNNREFISVNRDSAWGTSANRSIFSLNDSTVLFCAYNGGSNNSGALLEVNIDAFLIDRLMSFSSATGYGPLMMRYSPITNQVDINFSKGASSPVRSNVE